MPFYITANRLKNSNCDIFPSLLLLAALTNGCSRVPPEQTKSTTKDAPVLSQAVTERIQPIANKSTTAKLDYQPRTKVDTSGFIVINQIASNWSGNITLKEISDRYLGTAAKAIAKLDQRFATDPSLSDVDKLQARCLTATLRNYQGEPRKAAKALEEARAIVTRDPALAQEALYSLIYFQGVTQLRLGENENCVMCRGESSCILPISKAAQHINPEGSRNAIQYFTEYLTQFPDDLEVAWLLNLAHMTLGEYPERVNPKYLIPLDRFTNSEVNIGKFRDIGHNVGLDAFNQAGGAIMEDFNNDGFLDIVISSFDPMQQMQIFFNNGKGKFVDRTEESGLIG